MILLTCAVVACGDAAPTEPPPTQPDGEGVLGAWVRVDGRVRTYRMTTPASLSVDAPLLIVLHGAGGDGAEIQEYTAFDRAAEEGFVVVYPDGVSGQWGIGCDCTTADARGVDDVHFVRVLHDQLRAGIPELDASRVFLAGFSQGSMMAQRLACDAPDLVVGFGGVGGPRPRALDTCARNTPVHALLLHGIDDPTTPWDGSTVTHAAPASAGLWAEANQCAGPTREELTDLANDSTSVWLDRWDGCAGGGAVHLYGVVGGGHTWPGSATAFPARLGRTTPDVSATELILQFFDTDE
ncbi:MAG: PHB depolymerase family esterase [Gemmatimonadota bacterium]